ncbi:hypothetical protein HDG40_005789 [Paraburkholderia sp. JPY158]|uniref:DUF262 domain-containing protein n=1 Tax=Paraburkholderia atlantica TaxID=2654982 RepID=A0A7W8QC58_PARAM|nr:DUF262 domain-containing protein [Paraburkholderia atlantica]MBB5427610.1 hypothetical protein [Paraburkholderia atlantica]
MSNARNGLKTLAELFSGAHFLIPDYQRGYAWGKEQCEDFWKDIELLGESARHYGGQLILDLQASEEDHATRYVVVDGQQRLTSAIVALRAFVDATAKSELAEIQQFRTSVESLFHFEESESGVRDYKFGYADQGTSHIYLLGGIFADPRYVTAVAAKRTLYTENLRSAYELFTKRMSELDEPEQLAFARKLSDSLHFNVFHVDPQFDIHVAFETINNRGKHLSQLELLKNRLIYISTILGQRPGVDARLGGDMRAEINEWWSSIYSWLGNDPNCQLDDDEFLRTHWIAYFGYDKSESDAMHAKLFDDVFAVHRVMTGELTADDVRKYVRSLGQAATLWHYIHSPVPHLPSETVLWLERIERLRWGSFKPLVLSAFQALAALKPLVVSQPQSAAEYFGQVDPLLRQVERFIFMIFYVSERRAHTGKADIYRQAHRLHRTIEAGNFEEISSELEATVRFVGALNDNDDGDVRKHSVAGDYFDDWPGYFDLASFRDAAKRRLDRDDGYYGWDFTRAVLFEYELSLQGSTRPTKVDWKDASFKSVEHIYPQKPEDDSWTSRFPFDGRQERMRRMWRNSLGNLLLLSCEVNASLSNHPFAEKKKKYATGSYSENEVAQDYLVWSTNSVIKRGSALLEFAEKRWGFSFAAWKIRYEDCLRTDKR